MIGICNIQSTKTVDKDSEIAACHLTGKQGDTTGWWSDD